MDDRSQDPTPPRADLDLTDADLRELLRLMIRARALDETAEALQAEGELTVYPPLRGQEAAQVGSAFALSRDDMTFPTFREFAAALVRGVDPVAYLEYHRGTWHGGPYDPLESRFGPICITLATQIVHAVGFAMGQRLTGRPDVTLAYFGDGSTSEGDFHEACNFAAVFEAPIVLFCQNNGWAISVPTHKQMKAPVAERAHGYGMPGVRIDGNDVLAVWQTTYEAAERAREGGGPTLIEAMTYRLGPHHSLDEPAKYRTDDEVAAWADPDRDPIARYRRWLEDEGLLDAALFAEIQSETHEEMSEIADGVRGLEPPPVENLFEWVYEGPTPELLHQQRDISRFSGSR